MLNYDWLKRIETWDLERCGLVLNNGDVIEVPNRHDDPKHHFKIVHADIECYLGDISGVWHTHIDGDFNLSIDDYQTFISLPKHDHFIISHKGIAQYGVVDDKVINVAMRIFK